MADNPLERRQLTQTIRAELRQATGREHAIDYDGLDIRSLRELLRAVRDLNYEHQAKINRARLMPWRRS